MIEDPQNSATVSGGPALASQGKVLSIVRKYLIAAAISAFAINTPVDVRAEKADRGFQFTLGGSYGAVDQSDINDKYLDEYARPAGLFDDRVSNPYGLLAEIGYRLPPYHSLHIGLCYNNGGTTKDSRFPIIDYAQNEIGSMTNKKELYSNAIIPHVRLKYGLPRESFSPFLSLGVCYAFGKAVMSDDLTVDSSGAEIWSHEDKYTAKGWGWLGTVGVSHEISQRLSYGLEAGYRRLITDDLEDEDGEVWRFDGPNQSQAIRFDLSGWFLLGTFSVDL